MLQCKTLSFFTTRLNLQPPLQYPLLIPFLIQLFSTSLFHLPTFYLNHLYSPYQHFLPLYLSYFSTLYLLKRAVLQLPPKILSSTAIFQPIQSETRSQWAIEYCENLSLLPWSMGRDNSTHNYWSHIVQAKKIVVLQVLTSNEDVCYQNRKQITAPSPISSNYCHHFLPY